MVIPTLRHHCNYITLIEAQLTKVLQILESGEGEKNESIRTRIKQIGKVLFWR